MDTRTKTIDLANPSTLDASVAPPLHDSTLTPPSPSPSPRQAGRRALLIAFHYPPCGVSSGLQRTLCFSRDLPELGWQPVVLTAHPRAYRETRNDQLSQVPASIAVQRAFALDTLRHLGIRGRYFGWMALPDPWVTWLAGALPAGLRLIRKFQPAVLWSTYPVATAHLIGLWLHRLTGIPWVTDFRDPMLEIDPATQQHFPSEQRLWSAREFVERRAIRHCQHAVFVTPSALQICRERYPERFGDMSVIENGYDEATFASAEAALAPQSRQGQRLVLVHSGTLYPGPDRDASFLFEALARLRDAGKVSPATLQIRLRATGYDNIYRQRIAQFRVSDLVSLEPAIPYQSALTEMLEADGLLLFQGATSNPAVPAKLYEYLRARRPIFALVDSRGETAALLRSANVGRLVPLDSPDLIATGLFEFLAEVQSGTARVADIRELQRHSRKAKAVALARLFDSLAEARVRH